MPEEEEDAGAEEEEGEEEEEAGEGEGEGEGEVSDEDEKEKAATKIQAGYRGMRTRKEMKKRQAGAGADPDAGDDNGEPGEEMGTEMMIEGAAPAAEDDEGGLRSQLDDGYISPENPTWRSSNNNVQGSMLQNSILPQRSLI